MRTKTSRGLSVVFVAGMLTLGVASQAMAGPTTATVTVTGGSLSITVRSAAAGLAGSPASSRPPSPRRLGRPSVPSQSATPPGTIQKVGTATFTANDPSDLTGVVPAVTATGITGDNSATWNPTINVTVGGGMAAGVYSGTITHSIV